MPYGAQMTEKERKMLKKSKGLKQLMPSTLKKLGVTPARFTKEEVAKLKKKSPSPYGAQYTQKESAMMNERMNRKRLNKNNTMNKMVDSMENSANEAKNLDSQRKAADMLSNGIKDAMKASKKKKK